MLTVRQVAERLNVADSLVYGWCHSGQLAHLRLGSKGKRGCIRILEADLEAFLAGVRREVRQEATPPAADLPKRHRVADDFPLYYQRVMDEVAQKRRL
jgi:excisionase family DNA binding protein